MTCPCELSEFCGKRTDEEIIEFVKANKECYAILVQRYEAKLERYVRRISGATKESIEDILQSVFLKAYMNLNSFDEKNRFSPWIYRIAHNETVNFWRKNVKRSAEISLDDNEFLKNTLADAQSADTQTIQNMNKEKIGIALEKLTPKHKDILFLRFMDELSYQEIARKIGKPIGTVGTLINRRKKVLREELQRIGFSGEAFAG